MERPKDILIVDDSPMNVFVLENLLKYKFDRLCHTAGSGIEALRFCDRYSTDM